MKTTETISDLEAAHSSALTIAESFSEGSEERAYWDRTATSIAQRINDLHERAAAPISSY